MNLDNHSAIKRLDPKNMLGDIDSLPDQLQKAWDICQTMPLPESGNIRQIVVAGMGGSAIGAELLAAYVAPLGKIPVIVHRDYGLPGFARGRETLVIASSHSGNTEETLDAFEAALANGCSLLVLCTGGRLAQRAGEAGFPVWRFEHQGMPRAAVGYSFGMLLGLFTRLGIIPDPADELGATVAAMRAQQEHLGIRVPVAANPAKRMAGQLMGRWVNVIAAGLLVPIARRWKTQINELAKAGAGFEALPEANHNSLAGLSEPEQALTRTINLFLHAPSDHPRNRLRLELTQQAFLQEGLNADRYDAPGNSPLAYLWTALHFGDYLAYHLAIAYGVDPTPIPAIEEFKKKMG